MKTSTVFINDNGQFVRCTGPTYSCMVEQPTPEELAAEAAYYAWLESVMAKAVVVPDPVDFVDDDDGGYCGPTCGKYGDW